jgi:2-polyprenyl-3-methyl-5-hydroxy-6-metoxy-1,4-benzoquinol methylase
MKFFAQLVCITLSLTPLVLSQAQEPQPGEQEVMRRLAALPPDQQVYARFRRWWTHNKSTAPDITRALSRYREVLIESGLKRAEADRQIELIRTRGQQFEIDRWNQVLTSQETRFNTKPNAFLMEVVAGRSPGRALDVGMGQGRNALWLAQQGWTVTGFDPAERAVQLAVRNSVSAGVKYEAIIARDDEFDFGKEKWDLILFCYTDLESNLRRAIDALRPGGIIVYEYFHASEKNAPGGSDDNELIYSLGKELRVLRYEDADGIGDFGLSRTRLVRVCAQKRLN